MEQKAFLGKLWKFFGMEQYLCGMREHFTTKRTWAKAVLADAEKQKQEGIHGKWQMESPSREVVEQVMENSDLICNAYYAAKSGIWKGDKETHHKKVKLVNGHA